MAKDSRYKIERKVADGGMAEIFLAKQLGRDGFQKPVILKRIHSAIYADPQFRNMFIDEAHISMTLSHSNIVQVLDLGVSAGRYFLAMELVDGWDLGRVQYRAAAAGVPLPRELALHVVAEVCRALAYAHAKTDGDRPLGIVHRDVSPHNILLSEQGEVKLTDFGIAKAMNKREHTGAGVVKGKVAFMSPEQALGKPIDARSDLFSLGTVLYLLVTRARPFEGSTDLETLLRVQKGDYVPAEAVAPDLPPEVAAVVARALRHDPAQRYQSADEMLADVEHVLRSVFLPVGQTELKRWLADLLARDGYAPIGRSTARVAGGGARSGTGSGSGELEGKDVVLENSSDGHDIVDGEGQTSLAVVEGGGGRARLSRQRPGPALPVPQDAESLADLSGRAEVALPVPDGDERPDRRRARRSSGISILFIGALLVAGAWAFGKYAHVLLDRIGALAGGSAGGAGGSSSATLPPTTGDRAAARAPDAGAARARARAETEKPPAPARASAEAAPAREPIARRVARPAENPPAQPHDYRQDMANIKNMMAPDPSLLPASPTPPAPRPAEPAAPTPSEPKPATP